MAFPSDLQQHLIEVPLVARSGSALSESRGIRRAERGAPLANRLMADDDVALSEQVLAVTEAEVKSKIQPDGRADHLGREAMAMMARPRVCAAFGHRASLPAQLDNAPGMYDHALLD